MSAALADVFADACWPFRRTALPLGPESLSDPDSFKQLLERSAPGPCPLPGFPMALHETSIESPSSNCRNTIFELEWPDDVRTADAPTSLFVKQPSADFSTRLFANVVGFWKIECAFARHLAGDVPIAMPRIHAVAEHRSRFALVMENLRTRPGVRLHTNQDLLKGVDHDTLRRCLRTLAILHARFCDFDPTLRENALPLDLHPVRSPGRLPFMLALNRQATFRCHARAPEIFRDADAILARRALSNWTAMSKAWYREPLTLVHGDSHIGNFFADGDETGMIDFQGAHWSRGIRDVQYFLINSVAAEQLAACERDCVDFYCAERARAGSPLDADDAWHDYRGFSFQTLMTAVVSMGLGSFDDSEAVVHTMLERSVAAVRRLDFARWLDTTTLPPDHVAA